MAARKKVDVNADVTTGTSAAASFIKTPTEQANAEPKKNKSRRTQLMLVPDDWEKFQAFAHLAGTNPNQLVNDFVHETVVKYADRIAAYEKQRDAMREEFGVNAND